MARKGGEKMRIVTAEPLGVCWTDSITNRPSGDQGIAQCSPIKGLESCLASPAQAPSSVASSGHCLNKSRRHSKFEKCFVYKQDSPTGCAGNTGNWMGCING